MKQVSFRAHRRSSAVQRLFGRDSLKIRHPRTQSITVHLQSFVADLLTQVVGTPLEGDGGREVTIFSLLGVVRRSSDNCLRPARCWTIE
ncbi:hypothetical protein K443DRAFT_582109 [Laccaria amethystina LaAM-08-1]|uniref:Uncharacterized protein n=1 Tax=Laccaria amethystina LaAM-08-1 TaxID=1095629 RepID=A0A0C9WQM1_9AGAR|nr:hypothetical protein K443DRAFT_582109 [Laccaria amethystina LaAM-08-1]